MKRRFAAAGVMATLAIALAIGAVGLVLPGNAAAAPLGLGALNGQADLIQVRDGCGPGMRFSHSRDTCVEDFQRRDDFRDERRFRDERQFREERPRRDGDRRNRGQMDKRDFGADGQDN